MAVGGGVDTDSLPQGLLCSTRFPICFPDEQMTHQLPAAFPNLLFVFSALFPNLLDRTLLAASDGNQLNLVSKGKSGGSQMVVRWDFGRDVRSTERGSSVLQATQLSVVGRAGRA